MAFEKKEVIAARAAAKALAEANGTDVLATDIAEAVIGDVKATRFLSLAKSFKIYVYKNATGSLETGSGELQVKFKTEPVQIEFRNCSYSTSDQEIIDALRILPSFGGAQNKGFKRPVKASEPLFYEGGYPPDVAKKLKEEAGMLVVQEGFYEGEGKKERYSSQ